MKESPNRETLEQFHCLDREVRAEVERRAFFVELATFWGIKFDTDLEFIKEFYDLMWTMDGHLPKTSTVDFKMQSAIAHKFLLECQQFHREYDCSTLAEERVDHWAKLMDEEGLGMRDHVSIDFDEHILSNEAFDIYFEGLEIEDTRIREFIRKMFTYFYTIRTNCPKACIDGSDVGEVAWFILAYRKQLMTLDLYQS